MSGSQANCTDSGYNWVYNSLGQSPCFVAQSLDICGAQDTNIPPLPSGNTYGGPSVNETDSCRCSSVYYSLLAACSGCQDRNWIRWSTYTQNCSQVYLAIYPNTIPHSTRVPHWAYLDVSVNDTFDFNAASNAGGPESAQSPAPSSAGSLSNSSPNTVAIVSGVVGGCLGLTLIIGLSIFGYRRRRTRKRRARIAALREGPGILASPPPLIAFHTSNSF
ncbi:hypothetical protein M378DRAFT_157795 [Amanita muscaria Koide BX008]|uniref:Uncharacterized protein n=1 Tax=Amanita muscaria (strain Koide BX008) TaxID=946122 RepID=A0A0C2X3F5_AMAMK|nr:hypothetical protein M378DRAFT_157795 [Amanita muscaria Koide BX008]